MSGMTTRVLSVADWLLALLVYPAAWILLRVRRNEVGKLPHCKKALLSVGVFPIRNHYYEPQFDYRRLAKPLSKKRNLPAVALKMHEQLAFLRRMASAGHFEKIPIAADGVGGYPYDNNMFTRGDAEFWYQMICYLKPRRIFEVGSGYSTLMARYAIDAIKQEEPLYSCKHICIEPYEMNWLEKTGVTVLREKIESLGTEVFAALAAGDILFIDSSHIIRPQGDVLFEYLELLPSLAPGVVVHIHDIFTPRDYLSEWLESKVLFWNEQYLLEAFLSFNAQFEGIAALNYLYHEHRGELREVCPMLTDQSEPGSFYIHRLSPATPV